MMIFLETPRLMLRQFTLEDLDNLYKLDSNSLVMRFINGGNPSDYDSIKNQTLPRFLGYYDKYESFGFWAAIEKSSNNFIGWVHFYPAIENQFAMELNLVKPDEITLGYRLIQDSWGKGYATEASQAIIAKGFTYGNVQRVVAWVLVANTASIRVMRKVGLKLEKEFSFTQSQLPNLNAEERKAVKYGLDKDEFDSY